ncbi:winged helix-turn-helix domain-containing protein [Sphingomonas sp. 1P06PA]|uniref:winged helix-turn-helix domain-containing protein n=1 Tax=Sphingomonas sp. 1P06PA TaxID=554121 RepID=UPI0039A485E7
MRQELLGQGEAAGPLMLAAGALRLDLLDRSADHAGRALRLSPREFTMLALIVHAAPMAVPRTELLVRVLGCRHDPGTNGVAVHLSRLRAKLHRAGAPGIETVRGAGYRLRPAPAISR